MEKVMICGDTEWKDHDYIRKILTKFNNNNTIVHGKFPGVEFIVNFYCQLLELKTNCIIGYNKNKSLYTDNTKYSERLYGIYTCSIPDKILIIDNNFEDNERYNFIKYVSNNTEIIVIKSIMYH